MNAPPGEQHTDGRRAASEHEHLQRDLAHQTRPASAQRRVDGELAAASFHPHQLQVGDVGAGDEEDERHGREQRQQRPPRGADDRILEAADVDDGAAKAPAVIIVLQHGLQCRGRLGHRRTGLQPRHEIDLAPRRVAERAVGRHGMRRRPDVDPDRVVEIAGHHADDRVAALAQRDATAEHMRRAGEPRPPQILSDHEHRLGAVDVVGRGERAADHRRHPEHLEEGPGDERAVDGRPGAVPGQEFAADAVRVDSRHRGEVPGVSRGPCDGAIAERMMRVARSGQVPPRNDEGVLIADRQRPEQDTAYQREDEQGRRGAGRERQDGGDGEGARPEEAARDGSEILSPGAEHAPRSPIA